MIEGIFPPDSGATGYMTWLGGVTVVASMLGDVGCTIWSLSSRGRLAADWPRWPGKGSLGSGLDLSWA